MFLRIRKPMTLFSVWAVLACSSAAADESFVADESFIVDESFVVDEMVVVLIDAVNVPASESGVIAEITVREGNSVKAGQQLAKLDDRNAQLNESLALVQLEIATAKAADGLATDLAEKKLAEQQQLGKQHEIAREIAGRKAENEVRILASRKAEGVAKNELDRANRARQEYIDSVSQSEIDSLRLALERARLETEQAEFERRLDILHAKAEDEAGVGHRLSIDRSEIEVARAVAEEHVQKLLAELQRHQSQLANLARSQQRIISPLAGVVVERIRNQGEWVTAGDPVVRVIRLNRLRAEGFTSFENLERLRNHRHVQLKIQVGADRYVERDGEVMFISPEIDPVNNEVRFWVEFDNPKRDVLPGMRLRLSSKS